MRILSSLLVLMFCIIPAIALAQTPFDAFSPETSRIILDGDSIAAWRAEQQRQLSRRNTTLSRPDTILCALIADLRNEQLLLVDIATHRPVAAAPFTDEIKNWLSVDPLVDKNITTSPYLYCNGNPVMFIDPDGRDEWDFDLQGNLVKYTKNVDADIIRYVDREGKTRYDADGKLMEKNFAYGSIDVKIGADYTIISAANDVDGMDVFEFMAQSGIVTEWTLLQTGEMGVGANYISTSHKSASDNSYLKVPEFFPFAQLRSQIHNHPGDEYLPSGLVDRIKNGVLQKAGQWGDMQVKNNQQGRWGNSVVFKIYLPNSHAYISF